MDNSNSSIDWQKKGFGWIPDLPDLADPNLTSVLEQRTRILRQENTGYVEDIANHLVDLIQQDQQVSEPQLAEIRQKLLGDTYFPYIRVYKILRKENLPQAREVIQLRLTLYLIYLSAESGEHQAELQKYVEKVGELRDNLKTIFTPPAGPNLIQWLQNPLFDESLETLVIAFQSGVGLVGDGIVGLRTYTAIQYFLAGHQAVLKTVDFLCPSSLIPHAILAEIFQHLCYLWLQGKFRIQIDQAFQDFYQTHHLDPVQAEQIRQIRPELDYFICQQLSDINAAIREDAEAVIPERNLPISSLPVKNRLAALQALQVYLPVKIAELAKSVIKSPVDNNRTEKSDRSAGATNAESDHDFPLTLQDLVEHYIGELIDELIADGEDSQSPFMLNPNRLFVEQFHLWFHIIEPFVSALLQILSPLANFDNYRQAVKAGFDRLDSCFQLYQLEHKSRLTAYKTLLIESSLTQLSDQIEEFKALNQSITDLFQETLAKIDRIRQEDLNFRPDIIDGLAAFLKTQTSAKKTSKSQAGDRSEPEQPPDALKQVLLNLFLTQVESKIKSKFKSRFEQESNQSVWTDKLHPLATDIFNSRVVIDHGKAKLTQTCDLDKEKDDIKIFLAFFQFIEDLLGSQYGISLQGIQQEFKFGARKKADLISLLTAKKELFEIRSDQVEQAQSGLSNQSETHQFFEPVILQLPISTELLKQTPYPRQSPAKSFFFLPGVVDLSYWCTPIEDQGEVNACTAFAGVALLEYFAQRRFGKYTHLSPRFLYKTARNLMNRSADMGVSVRQTMKALVLFGVPPAEVWPWNGGEFNQEPPAFCYAYAQNYQALKYFRLDAANITSKQLLLFQIKAVLAAGLPCMFGFTMYNSFYKQKNIRRGHIPYPSDRDQVVGGHAAVAVGYNDYKLVERVDGQPAQPGAILIRNSWGTDWGRGGYGWLPYDYVLQGLTADWWSLLKSEWFDGGAFGLGAVDPGTPPDITETKPRPT